MHCWHWSSSRCTVNCRGVEGHIEPVERYVDYPDLVEVDEQVTKRALLIVSLEEGSVPVDAIKPREML